MTSMTSNNQALTMNCISGHDDESTTPIILTTRRKCRGLVQHQSRHDRNKRHTTTNTDQEKAPSSRPNTAIALAGNIPIHYHHHHTHNLLPMTTRISRMSARTVTIVLLVFVCAVQQMAYTSHPKHGHIIVGVSVSAFQFQQPPQRRCDSMYTYHPNGNIYGYFGGSKTYHHHPSLSLVPSRGQHAPRTNTNIYAAAAAADVDVDDTIVSAPPSSSPAVVEFSEAVQQAFQKQTLTSLTLQGVSRSSSKPPRNSRGAADPGEYNTKERLRGQIRVINGRLVALSQSKKKKKGKKQASAEEEQVIFLQMTFKYHGSTDIVKNWALKDIQQEIQSLSRVAAAADSIPIQSGDLKTSEGNWKLTGPTSKNGNKHQKEQWTCKQTSSTSTRKAKQSSKSDAIITIAQHDRTKQVPLSNQEDYLQLLGITNPQGQTRPGMQSKLKQCQKFVEIVSKLVEDIMITTSSNPSSLSNSTISVMDMGCGRGYVTFALHHYLIQRYSMMGTGSTSAVSDNDSSSDSDSGTSSNTPPHHMEVVSVGVELRPALVAETNSFCEILGEPFDTLKFVEGSIDAYMYRDYLEQQQDAIKKQSPNNDNLSVLIALHACDTATDDAIYFGIHNNFDLIVTAPCCHKQVRRQLDQHYVKMKNSHPLRDVLRHGIYRERISETVTDSIRALLLEIAHYNVQVFEFISTDHSGKNVMITATKRKRKRTVAQIQDLTTRLIQLCALHGIHTQTLANRMGLSLDDLDVDGNANANISSSILPETSSIKVVSTTGTSSPRGRRPAFPSLDE
jgi:hypothetical protein